MNGLQTLARLGIESRSVIGRDDHEPDAAPPGEDGPLSGVGSDQSITAPALRGVVGGLVATAVMTAFRIPISRSLPPTAEFWATYVSGEDAEDHPIPGIMLHLAYGAAAGGFFAPLVPQTGIDLVDERRGAVAGCGYGLLLSVFGLRFVLGRLLGQHLSADERFVFHVGHLVYGVTLGTWLGSKGGE